tara:strand:+ start:295 stop:1467 length:1173 start_codon:yes stop_codon:yes gene_type:complete
MNNRLKLFDLLRKESSTLFEGSHNIHTPKDLTTTVLNNVELSNRKILVLFNVEFVISLVELYNVDPANITFYSDHDNKTNLVSRFGVKYINTLEQEMKFDVVIANPPYQDSEDSGGTLWGKFASKAFNKLTAPDGYVVMIHPPSFIGKHQSKGKGKSDYSVFNNYQIEQIHLLDDKEKNKYFPGVGTKICWYIGRNQPVHTDTTVVGYDNGNTVEFMTHFPSTTFLPNIVNDLSIRIHNKLRAVASLKFNQKRELHYHNMKIKGTVDNVSTPTHPYKSYFSHKITRYSSFTFSDYANIKLMVPQTSTIGNAFIDKDCNVSEDLFYVCCNTNKEASDLLTYLNSNLVKYIGKTYRPGRNLGSLLAAGIIPEPTASIVLNQEELDYINANTK